MDTITGNKPTIELADPPAQSRGRREGHVMKFINTLRTEHPGQWAVYARNAKHSSYIYTLAKKHSDISVRTHRHDGQIDVYIKVDA